VQYLRREGRTISLGSAQLRALSPPRVSDQNTVGLLIEYGEFRAFLAGDSDAYEQRYWLEHESIPRVQVIKVPHHGAPGGTTPEWVDATHPAVAVISVGINNSYGHPSAPVIREWERVGARPRRTDLEGTIVVLASRNGTFTDASERSSVPDTRDLAS
jgi:competence protein ComEC